MDRDILIRLGTILLLAVLPFWLFLGETGRVVVNNVVVADRRLNYLGIVLAGVGAALAASLILRRSYSSRLDAAPTAAWARGIAAVLLLACLVQMALSADLARL